MEERSIVAESIRGMADLANDAEHDWSGVDEEKWVKINADYDQLSGQLEKLKRMEEVDQRQKEVFESHDLPADDPEKRDHIRHGRTGVTEEQRSLALQAWAKQGKNLHDDHEDACRACGINPRAEYIDLDLPRGNEFRNLQREMRMDTTATTGGETIPEGFVSQWEHSLLAFGGVRQVANIVRTATGADLPWPTTNDTGNTGELLAESASAAVQDVATSAITFNAYKYSSKVVKVSVELMEDSAFDLSSELGRLLGERIARITNNHFTVGTGSSQPNGLVTASSAGVTAAATGAIVAAELIDLVHSLDPAYRNSALNTGFMLEDATIKALRKLVDSDGRYMWSDGGGLLGSQQDSLLGWPVTVNQDVGSLATGVKTVVFGAFKKYVIRDVAGLRLRRLVERYAENDQEAFIAFSRHDGDLLDAGTDPSVVLVQA